jgi:hypothetical protein
MKEYYDKILKIDWDEDYYFIYCEKNNIMIKIINGIVDIEVKNSENKYIGFHNLNINDIIKIKYNNIINNFIIPEIIIIEPKYTFLNDSSDEENFY